MKRLQLGFLILLTFVLMACGGGPSEASEPPATEAPMYGPVLPSTPAAIEAPGPEATPTAFVCSPPPGYQPVPDNALTSEFTSELVEGTYYISVEYAAGKLTYTNADGSITVFDVTNGLNIIPFTLTMVHDNVEVTIEGLAFQIYICDEQMYLERLGDLNIQSS